MKIALRALNQQFVSAEDTITVEYQDEQYTGGAPTRPLQATLARVGPAAEFELMVQDEAGEWVPYSPPAAVPPDPILTPAIDPIDGIWPPPEGTIHVRPPDYATTNVPEVRRQLRWALWVAESSDDESYWMRVIVLAPEEGHTPGWTGDTYWADRVKAGDGAGSGYRWPPT
jgi:hypothetical protein